MKLIVANWKMNPQSLLEARKLFNSVKSWVKKNSHLFKKVKIVICPPFVYLEPLSKLLKPKTPQLKLSLGAQNLFWEKKGAFTGEISATMLKNLGVEYVILGHSERRKILGETDEIINKKLKAAIGAKLKPILCLGETEKERKSGKIFKVLQNQLNLALKNISNFEFRASNLTIAYEPVWAIGTGNPCRPKEAKEVLTFLKKKLKNVPILYGGSVDSQNAFDYLEIGFDGLLVGGASLRPKEFLKISKLTFLEKKLL
jgi:triosephosphate isomerase